MEQGTPAGAVDGPGDPALIAAQRALERGDHRAARRIARSGGEAAARLVRAALRPDPFAVAFAVLGYLALLAAVFETFPTFHR